MFLKTKYLMNQHLVINSKPISGGMCAGANASHGILYYIYILYFFFLV